MSALAGLLLAFALAMGENRAWLATVEAVGPIERFEVDCGPDGVFRWEGQLLEGERRNLELVLPVRVPLGSVALDRVPPPPVRTEGEGTVRWLDWRAPQPGRGLENLPPGIRARPLPPLDIGQASAGMVELTLLALAGVLAIAARRRPVVVLVIGVVAAGGLLLRGGPTTGGLEVRVVEGDLARASWVDVRSRRDSIELAFDVGLERRPSMGPVDVVASQGGASIEARAEGAELFTRRTLAGPPPLEPAANRLGDLVATWLRDADGVWTARGPWPEGEAFAGDALASSPGEGSGAPGWLRAGLPPGRPALLGRLAAHEGGGWVRVSDFEAPAPAEER